MKKAGCFVIVALLALVAWYGGVFKGFNWKEAAGSAANTVYGLFMKLVQSDDTLLVNADHPLPADYQPADLVCLYDVPHSFQLARSDIYLCRKAYEAAEKMFAAAQQANVSGFVMTLGYTTPAQQAELYAQGEHQTGLAFDVTAYGESAFKDTEQYEWISRNCWKYGFVLRYPEGKEDVTGAQADPGHYRYVGAAAAALVTLTDRVLEDVFS